MIPREKKYEIRLTEDTSEIAICAVMMSGSDPWITLNMDQDQCRKAFDGPCKEIYILQYEREIAGFMIIQVCGTFSGYIQTLCISEGERGKGLGTKLLQFGEQRILRFSPNIFICVSSFNKGAIQLYEEFGFKLVGELKDFVKPGFTELFYRKTFGPIIGY